MKIKTRDIPSLLKKPEPRYSVFLLYGMDQGLIREYRAKLAAHFSDNLDDPFSVVSLSGSDLISDPVRLSDEVNSLAHFGSTRLVLLSGTGTDLTAAVKHCFADMNHEARLIIRASDVNTRHALVQLCDRTDFCASIGCYPDDSRSLRALAQEIFTREKITISSDGLNLLSSRLGSDRQSSLSELEKLVLYSGPGGTLSSDDIDILVGDSGSVLLDELIISVLEGRVDHFERAYMRMRAESIAPISTIRQLLFLFRSLWSARLKITEGQALDQVLSSMRPPLHFRLKPSVSKFLAARTPLQIGDHVRRLAQIELQIKSSFAGDPAILLGQTLLGFCLRARPRHR